MATQEHENGHGASMKSKIYLHLKSSVCKRETKHKKRKPALILTVLCNDSLQTCFASIYGSSWKNKRLRDSMTDLRHNGHVSVGREDPLGVRSSGFHLPANTATGTPYLFCTTPPASGKATAWPWRRSWSRSCGRTATALLPIKGILKFKHFSFSFSIKVYYSYLLMQLTFLRFVILQAQPSLYFVGVSMW